MTTEDIASNLKLSEEKQRSLGKAHETLRAQADSMFTFTLQWEELEDHFDSIRQSLHTQFQEAQELNKETASRLANLEAKAKELQGIVQEAEESKSQLHSLKLSIQEHCEKCEVEESRLGKVQKLVKGKEMEYYNIQQRIKEVSREIEAKERQLSAVRCKVVDQWKEFDLKDEEIRAKQTLIEEYDREVSSIQKLMRECPNSLESKMKDFRSLEKSVAVWDCKLELKELETKIWVEKLEKQFESKVEEINLIDKRVNDSLNEVQLKEKILDSREKHLDLLDKSLQECTRQLEQKTKELELKKELKKSTEEHKSKEKADILHSQVKIEQLEYIPDNTAIVSLPAGNHSSINRDGRSLQLLMIEYFRKTDSVSIEVSARLQVSSDPAKLVLDAMQGFYPTNSTVENREFDFELSVIRRSCIHLLKELKRISPQISDQVREETKKLAGDWKSKMTVAAENWLEVLGFLWLVTAYELTSISDRKELKSLLDIAAEHEKQLDEFCGILDIADKDPASSNICSSITTEKPESSLCKNAANFSSPNFQVTTTTDARNLQGLSNDHLSGNHIIQNGALQIACGLLSALNVNWFVEFLGMISQNKQTLECFQGFGFGDKISDVIPILIQRKQAIEAVRVIYTFNLIDKFPPVPLLKEYVEDAQKCSKKIYMIKKSPDEKDKVVNDHISKLRAVIQCVKDNNLESEYLSSDIETKIAEMQTIKENLRRPAACPGSKVEQEQKKGRKRRCCTTAPKFQPKQAKIKCQLTAASADTTYALATTPGYPLSSSSCLLYENNGHPGQFGMAASDTDNKGKCFHCNESGHWLRNCPIYLSKKKRSDMINSLPHKLVQSSSSSCLLYENNGDPGQFGMAANDNDSSKRICFHCSELGHLRRSCPVYLSEKKKSDMSKSLVHKSPL